jgi:hypothetical protein
MFTSTIAATTSSSFPSTPGDVGVGVGGGVRDGSTTQHSNSRSRSNSHSSRGNSPRRGGHSRCISSNMSTSDMAKIRRSIRSAILHLSKTKHGTTSAITLLLLLCAPISK